MWVDRAFGPHPGYGSTAAQRRAGIQLTPHGQVTGEHTPAPLTPCWACLPEAPTPQTPRTPPTPRAQAGTLTQGASAKPAFSASAVSRQPCCMGHARRCWSELGEGRPVERPAFTLQWLYSSDPQEQPGPGSAPLALAQGVCVRAHRSIRKLAAV